MSSYIVYYYIITANIDECIKAYNSFIPNDHRIGDFNSTKHATKNYWLVEI